VIGLLYFVRPVPGIGDKACPIGCRSIEVLLKNTIIIGIKVLRLSQEADSSNKNRLYNEESDVIVLQGRPPTETMKHFPLFQKISYTVKTNLASDTFPCDFFPKICLFICQNF